jgi:flagellar transcriptional activator FlhC
MLDYTGVDGIQAILKAYRLYTQQVHDDQAEEQLEPVLSLTRAWTLVRFVESKMLTLKPCSCCGGNFIVNTYDLNQDYVCNLCHVPSRAGKTKKAKELSYKLVSMSA